MENNKPKLSMEDNILEDVISNMNRFNNLKKKLEIYADNIGIEHNITILYSNNPIDFKSKDCYKDIENKEIAFNNVKEQIQDAIHLLYNLDTYNKNSSVDIAYEALIINIVNNDITIKFVI